MNPTLATLIYLADIYFIFKTYALEKRVVDVAHKKYAGLGTTLFMAFHGVGSFSELTLGYLACVYPSSSSLARATAYLALLVNLPSGFVMTPKVFGVRHLTVPGFTLMGVLRLLEAARVLTVDHRLAPNLWILLQVGTLVRLLGYFVLPYSSKGGPRGAMFTEPVNYSFNILLSGYFVAMFVYPPQWLFLSLGIYAVAQNFMPVVIVPARKKVS